MIPLCVSGCVLNDAHTIFHAEGELALSLVNCAHFSSTPHSLTSHWELEMSCGGSVHTTKLANTKNQGFWLGEWGGGGPTTQKNAWKKQETPEK